MFWEEKTMEHFSPEEWEMICLKCGKCCCVKHEDNENVFFTNRLCESFDLSSGLCKRYDSRLCADCLKVDWSLLCNNAKMLPKSCAYRQLKEEGKLPEYHPLITGDADSVRKAKQSVLDWEDVHTIADIRNATNRVLIEADRKNWTISQYEDAIEDAIRPYPMIIVEKHKK